MELRRELQRFHLATAVVVMLGAGALLWLNVAIRETSEVRQRWTERVWTEMGPGEWGTYNPGYERRRDTPLDVLYTTHYTGWPFAYAQIGWEVEPESDHPPMITQYFDNTIHWPPGRPSLILLLLDLAIVFGLLAALGVSMEYALRRRLFDPLTRAAWRRARRSLFWTIDLFITDMPRE